MKTKRRTFNVRRIKATMTYLTRDLADLFNIHKRTVQNWHKEGLQPIDDKKPYLYLGKTVQVFLRQRQAKRKIQCRDNELYCCKCRAPRTVQGNTVTIAITNSARAIVLGLCAVCSGQMRRIISTKNITQLNAVFAIETIRNRDLTETACSIVNTDMEHAIHDTQKQIPEKAS